MAVWADKAIVVVHGIGVQRREATLNSFISSLKKFAGVTGGRRFQEDTPFGEPLPPDAARIERNGVSADLYEVYWAPLTSRKTTARSVLWWLFRTTFVPGESWRPPSRKTLIDLVIAFIAVSFVLLTLTLGLSSLGNLTADAAKGACEQAAGDISECETVRKDIAPENGELTGDAVTVEGGAQLSSVISAIADSVSPGKLTNRPLKEITPTHAAEVLQEVAVWTWIVLMGVVFVTAQALYRLGQIARSMSPGSEAPVLIQIVFFVLLCLALFALIQLVPPVLVAFTWVLVLVGFVVRRARHFLSESLGDVQVYSERDENSEHAAAREAVLGEAEKVFSILSARDYKSIVVIGHSLGSVVAFTAMDRLTRRTPDLLPRIESFITIGTALEKVRYFFERKNPSERSAVEIDNAAKVLSRDRVWLNLWYLNDPVANPITTFQEGKSRYVNHPWRTTPELADLLNEGREKLVANVSFGFPLTPVPIWTHSKYWNDPPVIRLMADVALGPRAPTPGASSAAGPRP